MNSSENRRRDNERTSVSSQSTYPLDDLLAAPILSPSDQPHLANQSMPPRMKQLIYLAAGIIAFIVIVLSPFRVGTSFLPSSTTQNASLAELLSRSELAYNSRQYHEAITHASAALKINPQSAEAHNNLAVSHLALWDFRRATEHAQKAIQLDPNLELARNNLKWIQSRKAIFDASVANPKTAEDWVNRSLDQYQKGQHAECMESALQASRLNGSLAPAYNNLSTCALASGNFEEAVLNAAKALSLDPEFDLARNNMAAAIEARRKAQGQPQK